MTARFLALALAWVSTSTFGAERNMGFPLPAPDGKPLAASAKQRTFRVPFRYARVAQFYKERLSGDPKVQLSVRTQDGVHVLTIKSTRPTDLWAKAVIREGEVDTTVEVTPVVVGDEERVEGNGRPLVELVITRSKEFDRMVDSIDHSGDARPR